MLKNVEDENPLKKEIDFEDYDWEEDNNTNKGNITEKQNKAITYDGKFYGNTLMIGPTQFGKTFAIQQLIKNGFLKQDELIWVQPHGMDDNFKKFAREVRLNFPKTTVTLVSLEKDGKHRGEYLDKILKGIL